ncbi:ABC transporter ATP-binding protein [Paenibacillus sp. MSJ-34]|uniref:ABC transporter ATP-binding protein n=1 Tax=Paenibacillus sp. MSJ-34 TaxID=2841529 RepID=UPI001C110786|nr:ABC transporter ATP-binding protein [Paenibacillus sp. MSJ-34]MBU5444376.1 ABC transporter ATP-binding protein [Paenibacillus sp. MSJ-34]
MSYEVVIDIHDVSKTYRYFNTPAERLKQLLFKRNREKNGYFSALSKVSLKVSKGEKVGIIGRNGSGKSTLLQIIAGILTPSSGNVHVKGRVAALLELGSGFNPEFTGKENVFLNGAIFGLTHEQIEEKFDEIVNFSEIGDFINQPVKTYSSGMFVRLAFSVAVHVNPEILIVDEALAVGDVFFQRKCFSKIDELNRDGCTLIYVTHELANLKQVVNRAILLDKGELKFDGSPVDAVNKFYKNVYGIPLHEKKLDDVSDVYPSNSLHLKDRERYGTQFAQIESVIINGADGTVWSGKSLKLKLLIRAKDNVDFLVFGIRVKTKTGIDVFASNTRDEGIILDDLVADSSYEFQLEFENFNLIAGEYFLSLALGSQQGDNYIPVDHRIDAVNLKVLQAEKSTGITNLQPKISITKGASI